MTFIKLNTTLNCFVSKYVNRLLNQWYEITRGIIFVVLWFIATLRTSIREPLSTESTMMIIFITSSSTASSTPLSDISLSLERGVW